MSTILSRIPKFAVKAATVRQLSLQEHEAMKLLNQHKIKTPRFGVAATPSEADKVARDLLTKNLMVKAQVLADGRDTGHFTNCFRGGIHSAISPGEVKEISEKMLGQRLITWSTDSSGKICNSVLVGERKFPRRKFYFAITLDPLLGGAVVSASSLVGNGRLVPEMLFKCKIDPSKGLDKTMAYCIARKVGICDQPAETENMLMNLYQFFIGKDLVRAEINPWIEDVCSNFYASGVKLKFDDNAQFRQQEIFNKSDRTQDDANVVAAEKLGLKFKMFDKGSIGCIGNGRGLELATQDILCDNGCKPVNWMNVSSLAYSSNPDRTTSESIKLATEIVLKDERVKTIFVNIIALGQLTCDAVVDGLIKASIVNERKIPIVMTFKGEKQKESIDLMRKKMPSNLIYRKDLDEAAQMAVRCSQIIRLADKGDLDAMLKMKVICECDPITPKPTTPPQQPPCPSIPKVSTKLVKYEAISHIKLE